ncbi:hypothetical protein ACF0H5_015706 [Mactra antiquata]
MALLCDGHLKWSTEPITSKETRDWLHLDDELSQSGTSCFDKTFIKKLVVDKQWLSLHKCIDDACPVHAEMRYPETLTKANIEDDTDIDNIEDNVQICDDVERSKCRRQLFGDDVLYNQSATGSENYTVPEVQIHCDSDNGANVFKQTSALQNTGLGYEENYTVDSNPATTCTLDKTLPKADIKYHATDVTDHFKESNLSALEPRFLCTWLRESVSIDKYPLYKLSLSSAAKVPPKREKFGVFSEDTTDCIWKSHSYIGEVDNDKITIDKTLNSSCKKSKSLDNCTKETPASVLKEIFDVDISDLKTKYSFLFHPSYIFQTKNIANSTTLNQYTHAHDNVISPQYGTGVYGNCNKNYNQGYQIARGLINPKYTSVNLPKLNPYVSATNSPHIQYNYGFSPLLGYQNTNYQTGASVNFSKSIRDPRLNRVKAETLGTGDRSSTNSPSVNYESGSNKAIDFSDYLYNLAYGRNGEESPMYRHNMPSPMQGVNDQMTYDSSEPESACIDHMRLSDMKYFGSPAVSGLSILSESPIERYTVSEPNFASPFEKRFYFQNWCKSPLSDNGYSATNVPRRQQRYRRDDERHYRGRCSQERTLRSHDNEYVASRSRNNSSRERDTNRCRRETRETQHRDGYFIDRRRNSFRRSPVRHNTSARGYYNRSGRFNESRNQLSNDVKERDDKYDGEVKTYHRSSRDICDKFVPSRLDRTRSRESTNRSLSRSTRDRICLSESRSRDETKLSISSQRSVHNKDSGLVKHFDRDSRQYVRDRKRRPERNHNRDHKSLSNVSMPRPNSQNGSRPNSQNISRSRSTTRNVSSSNSKFHHRSHHRTRSRSRSRVTRKSRN